MLHTNHSLTTVYVVNDGGSGGPDLDSIYYIVEKFQDTCSKVRNLDPTNIQQKNKLRAYININDMNTQQEIDYLNELNRPQTVSELEDHFQWIYDKLKGTNSDRFFAAEPAASLLKSLQNLIEDYKLLSLKYSQVRPTLESEVNLYSNNLKNIQRIARKKIEETGNTE